MILKPKTDKPELEVTNKPPNSGNKLIKKEAPTAKTDKNLNATNKMQRETLTRLLAELYQGCADGWLAQPAGDKRPHSESTVVAISAGDIETLHLNGATGLGVYPVLNDGTCKFAVIDLDNKPDRPNPKIRVQVKNICRELLKNGLDHRVCTSQSGRGFHIALYFAEWVPAWLVRNVLKAICTAANVPGVEIFPKQSELKPGQVGSAVRLPLFRKSRFIDPRNDWKELEPVECLRSVEFVRRDKLDEVAERLNVNQKKPSVILHNVGSEGFSDYVQELLADKTSLLVRRWNGDLTGLADGTDSALVMAIACCLIRKYVPTAEIEAALRHWCTEHVYDKGGRDDWLQTTIRNAYAFVQKSKESGLSQLADEFSAPIARQIRNASRRRRFNKTTR